MNTNPLQLEQIISFAATKRLIGKLDREAKRNGVSRSEIIRTLLYRGIDWMHNAKAPEVFEALHYARTQDAIVNVEFDIRSED